MWNLAQFYVYIEKEIMKWNIIKRSRRFIASKLQWIFLLGAAISWSSCSTAKMDTPEDATKLANYSKSACYGDCPVYNVAFTTDGKMVYTGKRNVDKIGIFEQQLTKEEYSKLVKFLRKAKLDQYQNMYDEDIADGAITRLTYYSDNEVQQIATKFTYPGDLKSVMDELEVLATRETGWVQVNVPIKKESEPVMEKSDQPTRRVISYNQGPCFGTCAYFSIDILSDQTVLYVGKKFVDKEGIWEKTLSNREYGEIVSLFAHEDFTSQVGVYDQNIMDAQQFTITYTNRDGIAKTVKTKITQTPHIQEIISEMNQLVDARGWKKKEADKDAVPVESTILVSLSPKVDARKWVTTKKHLGLKIVRFLSPNGTYFLVSYDMEQDINRVMEELRRDRDVLNVDRGDRPSKPRTGSGVKSGKSGNRGTGRLDGGGE